MRPIGDSITRQECLQLHYNMLHHHVWQLLQDAMQSLSSVVDAQLDAQAAFNLVLCTFALGDKEMMKQAFTRLIEVCTSFST